MSLSTNSRINKLFGDAEIEAITNTLKIVSNDPQVVEYICTNGITLYIRYSKNKLVCRNKTTNEILCSDTPMEYRDKIFIPTDNIIVLIERSSNFKIKFI